MTRKLSRTELLSLAALGLAWVSVWGAWIPHRTASLTQNAFYLAEWSGVLTDVRFGQLRGVPDVLRLAVALAAIALAVGASMFDNHWLRWVVRLVSALPGLVLLPPYPFVLQLWYSEVYGTRFVVAMVLWVGVAASGLVDLCAPLVRRFVTLLLAATAAGLGAWTFLVLHRPFEAHYAGRIAPGWGVVAFIGGLAIAAAAQAAGLVRYFRDRAKSHSHGTALNA